MPKRMILVPPPDGTRIQYGLSYYFLLGVAFFTGAFGRGSVVTSTGAGSFFSSVATFAATTGGIITVDGASVTVSVT